MRFHSLLLACAVFSTSCSNTQIAASASEPSHNAMVLFAAFMGNERLALTCNGPLVVDTSCRIKVGSPGGVDVRFTAPGANYRYPSLLKDGIKRVIESKQHPLHPSASDIQLLHNLDLEKCYPAAESAGLSGDLLQLCIPQNSSNVVLFIRGLCDRCEFEPIVLKRQAAL